MFSRAAESSAGNPTLNMSVFVAFIVVTLGIVTYASRRQKKSASDSYTGGEKF